MVQTRSRNNKRRSSGKVEKGCFCCAEKTKCSNNSNQKGGNYIENSNFVNVKDTYTRVSKKPPGRKSPITTAGLSALQLKRNCSKLDSRTPQDCVVVVSDWLRQFQQDVPIELPTPMEDSSSTEDTPSTSTSPASPQSQEHEEQIEGAASPDVESMGPPSVSSSVSAPLSPVAQSPASTYSQGGSSSTSQDDQPDTTGQSSRPRRTPERREKQRIASAKSRRKKKGEGETLKEKADLLEKKNADLVKHIEQLEIQRKRYLSGEYEYDDSDIHDPEDESDNEPDGGPDAGGAGGRSGGGTGAIATSL